MKPSHLVVIGFLFANLLTATTFDHYTTQFGQIDSSTVQYGNLSVSVSSDVYPPHQAQVGYHDTLEIMGSSVTNSGILDIIYLAGSTGIGGLVGDFGGNIAATGLVLPDTNFFYLTVAGQIPFQYNTPFPLDALAYETAVFTAGTAFVQIKNLTVEGNNSFLWAASSGTQYPFTNGQFTPTPEPSTLAMMLFAASIAGLILYRRSFRRIQ